VRVYRLTEAARAELDGRFLEAVGRCWPPAEAGPERLALFAVGASPAVLRRTAAAAAALLALLGAAPAVPAGLLPVAAIYAASPTLTPAPGPMGRPGRGHAPRSPAGRGRRGDPDQDRPG
jgi:hypothetical protein